MTPKRILEIFVQEGREAFTRLHATPFLSNEYVGAHLRARWFLVTALAKVTKETLGLGSK